MRKWMRAGLALAAAWHAAPALASGDYCQPVWKPENPDLGCTSSIVLAPGNDSRVNLFLLLQDRAGRNGAMLDLSNAPTFDFYGNNFFRWSDLGDAWYPRPASDDDDDLPYSRRSAGRCQTIASGKASFLQAVARATQLDGDDRSVLALSRDRLDQACEKGAGSLPLPSQGNYFLGTGFTGIEGMPAGYMAYLEASASFYAGDFGRALEFYRLIEAAKVGGWPEETARYMIARTLLNQAMVPAEDEWGFFALDKVDVPVAKASEQAFGDYLQAYPGGAYAASARGLIRKTLWLQSDFARLGARYAELLAGTEATSPELASIVAEIDDKLLVRDQQGSTADPLLTATNLLMRMRPYGIDYDSKRLTAEELEAKAPVFANHPELWSFLQANHAFYVRGDYAAARDLLPDDAARKSYDPLAFSRQYLRGLALHALKDRNEEGFWRELIGGANGIWQRPAVELALARLFEQSNEATKAFAADSPIRDDRIRRMLLASAAGPQLLKAQARAKDGPDGEASFATFVVLWRQLERGEYAGFLQDLPLARQFAPPEEFYGLWNALDAPVAPAAIFTNGKVAEAYPCPSLEATVRTLSTRPRDTKALLCLGDFYRLNGFDDFSLSDRYRLPDDPKDELGSHDYYPGKVRPRHDFYTAIIADPAASRADKAYAYYRAIRCYAPGGGNSCGGEAVDLDVRAAWFRRLKSQYADTRWARELQYYW